MLHLLIALFVHAWSQPPAGAPPVRTRPADIAFRVQMIDPGFSENGRIYIAYSGAAEGERHGLVLRRLQAVDPAANRFESRC